MNYLEIKQGFPDMVINKPKLTVQQMTSLRKNLESVTLSWLVKVGPDGGDP